MKVKLSSSKLLEQLMAGETPRHVTTKELEELFRDVFSREDNGLANQIINVKSFFVYGTRI